ncbi:MAG: type II and III secretion system protein [Betaproteobacteria bacterium]|nr:type II and III secretion system protein [Betaproteobacteria bacterium]
MFPASLALPCAVPSPPLPHVPPSRELKTSVSVRDDELFIMGGLDETRESASSRGVPFLPGFLRGRQSDHEATEILLMLHVKRI